MSILIKGMQTPNNCGTCPLRLAWCRERLYMVTRPPRCPLIELPDHGDLVDVDLLKAECQEPYVWWETATQMKVILADAPVVIPAERSEE